MTFPLKADGLTKQEKKIATYLAQGLTKPQIAERLTINLWTVRSHCANIKRKWDMPTQEIMTLRAEAQRRGYYPEQE